MEMFEINRVEKQKMVLCMACHLLKELGLTHQTTWDDLVYIYYYYGPNELHIHDNIVGLYYCDYSYINMI